MLKRCTASVGFFSQNGTIKLIDGKVGVDAREEVTTGEAVAAMIINGLDFSDRPLTLTPQFFSNKPMENLTL